MVDRVAPLFTFLTTFFLFRTYHRQYWRGKRFNTQSQTRSLLDNEVGVKHGAAKRSGMDGDSIEA